MQKALFVIDVQGFFENKNTKKIASKIRDYIKKNKNQYSLIVFTIFKNNPQSPLSKIFKWTDCKQGKDIEIMEELSDLVDNSKIVFRNTYSLFKVPRVKMELKKNKIKQVDICGFETDACVLVTTYDLFDSGYKPVVLKNLCFSNSREKLHKPALAIIKRSCGFLKK